ncbi:GDP-mannose 4,6-dehydratase [Vibrio cholerae]|uniref:GDP-mannose 4,6-dehydratase n=1 Tax=Vibrio cholerae TaxID=666 RepID=UPI0004D7A226|nr:GDP-mannose 4,6-dehydratase [Vibrio cholerae]EGR0581288.1 NAD-dependent epimerase/dehydratase family protein [Vibrio cholerae]EGR1041127.1 NAD-dependent epimerase/dehydratase family protein [Vibrio cholerae]KEH06582.1 epimerase [Vibrio cholerae 2012EL-1759]NOE71626.1 NAD-dependent epimerase/dehydratase family protein [Vibrio cholerae]NOE90774.1 NAD-dependent epimerase/dehydratase family protein [Vibrio cholerae]
MKKVLLTGVDGFTGKYVAEELTGKGYQVVGLVYKQASEGHVACDLTDKQAVKNCLAEVKPDYVIHLAALSFVGHADQKAFYDVNVFGALNILEMAKEIGISFKKVIFASSANIYGNPIAIEKIDESVIPTPVNHYAMSKLAMEHMAKLWFDDFPLLITRPFNYTGPGQAEQFLIPKIVSHFKKNAAEIELGNIDVYRDFSDVRDIAKAYVRLLESDAHSEIVNLCSGNVFSLSSIISKMGDIAGYKINVKVNPAFVRTNEIKILGGDNSKLVSLTGFKPTITIDQTLLDMYNAN